FFSSRRRHTRFSRDWSSDVCSSDLMDNPTSEAYKGNQYVVAWFHTHPTRYGCGSSYGTRDPGPSTDDENEISAQSPQVPAFVYRSEERRVGKECSSRWSRDHHKKK